MRDKQGGIFTNFVMFYGMNRPGREPTTYCVRGGYANQYGNKPPRRDFGCFVSSFTYKIINLHIASVEITL